MTAGIDDLNLKGAEVRQLRLSPGKYLALELMLLPTTTTGQREVRVMEILFESLHRYKVRASGAPWLEVVGCRRVWSSDFRDSFVPHQQAEGLAPVPREQIAHFEIVFDGGSIDILAENWTTRTIETLPVQDGPACHR